MPPSQEQFVFNESRLQNVERRISKERLEPYLHLANDDRQFAIRIYEWNTSLSESFYGILQGFEVALRNSFHQVLSNAFARGDWYDAILLKDIEAQNLQAAKGRLLKDGKVLSPAGMVAELYFGFWVSLTGPHYGQTLWDAHLYRAFRQPMKRDKVCKSLSTIRKLRNRVAHHEIIVGRNLNEDYSLIITTTNWICPDTAKWIGSNSTFLQRYFHRPQPPAISPQA
jgi:Abi-like protein